MRKCFMCKKWYRKRDMATTATGSRMCEACYNSDPVKAEEIFGFEEGLITDKTIDFSTIPLTSGHLDFQFLSELTERQRRSVKEFLNKELKPGYMPSIVKQLIDDGRLDVDFL